MRALKISPDPTRPQAQAPEDDVLRRWAARRRELLLVDAVDKLVLALERLARALERRAA